jgi:hypothetical protein
MGSALPSGEAGGKPAGEDVPVSAQAGACAFGLCAEAVPADSSGMAALAGTVRDSATALGMAWWAGAPAYAPRPDTFVWIQTGKLGYGLRLGRQGLFARVDVRVIVEGGSGELELRSTARVGQRKSLAGFPAVGRLDYDPNLYLAGNTNVYGPMLMWRGDMGLASDFDIRYTGGTPKPTVWKSENPIWKNLPLTFPGTKDWMAAQDSVLDAADPGGAAFQDPWFATRVVPGGTVFKDTTLADARILSKGRIVLGAGSVLRNCIVIAGEAGIEGNADIANSLVYGRERLIITGSPALTGQYLSRDSLYLETREPFAGYPVFYVHGNRLKPGGRLVAAKASGEAILVYGGDRNAAGDLDVHMITRDSVDIKGLIYANGNATIGGTTHGSVLFDRPVFIGRTGTTYVGFLVNAQYHPPEPAALLPLPLVLDPAEPAVLSISTALSYQAH